MSPQRTRTSLAQLRLANQRILGSSFTDPADAVRWMLAVQAQDFPGAKWSVALRTPGCTDAGVEAALAERTIVRSWPLRGTLHFCAAEDLAWMLALCAPRILAGAAARRAALDLDEATLGRAREIAVARLTGGKVLTREQLLAELDRAGVYTTGQRGYHLLWHLSQTGILCFGPPRAKEQTFVLLDEWVPRSRRLDRDEALGELARRYFESHGPATPKDLAGWAKLTAGDAKTGVALARPHLAELVVDGATHFMAADAERVLAGAAPKAGTAVVALPGFDEYVLGYQDRSAVLAPEHSERICPGANGIFMPTVVVGGQIVGTWRRVVRSREVVIEPTPFTKLSAAARAGLGRAAEAFGKFLGLPGRVA
jgi:hypothetical protein